jgi:hypothetical protein
MQVQHISFRWIMSQFPTFRRRCQVIASLVTNSKVNTRDAPASVDHALPSSPFSRLYPLGPVSRFGRCREKLRMMCQLSSYSTPCSRTPQPLRLRDQSLQRPLGPVDLPFIPSQGHRWSHVQAEPLLSFFEPDNRRDMPRTSNSHYEQASQGFLDVRGCLTQYICDPRGGFTGMPEAHSAAYNKTP